MLHKLKCLGGALLCISSSVMAETMMYSTQRSFSLTPNENYEIETPFFISTLDATCKINFPQEESLPLRVQVHNGSGSVNGRSMQAGFDDILTFQNNQILHIRSTGKTKVNLINLSSNTLSANCDIEVH